MQKSRLVEKIAELLNEKKLPLVGDVRDESAEDVRLVIEPKSRTVDPELLMESLFRLTELESRIPLNLNVLIKGKVPRVVGLAECLREWLDHLRDVLIRRTNHRKGEIEHRLEVLGGYLIAYLNIDKVIKIIRTEDEPKPVLMKAFKLTDIQADSILNMRLRNLRKLEEMEIRTEDKNLRNELKGIKSLLGSEKEQWAKVGEQVRKVRDMFGPKTPLGKRRTSFADAPEHDLAAIEEAFVEREPVTVVVSEKGWVRTMKGHMADLSALTFKTDDKLDLAFFAESTVEAAGVRHQRQILLARCRQAAGRPRPWRADPHVHRHGSGRGHRLAVRQQGRPQIPGRQHRGAGLHRQRGRVRRQHPQGQAGDERDDAGRGHARSPWSPATPSP